MVDPADARWRAALVGLDRAGRRTGSGGNKDPDEMGEPVVVRDGMSLLVRRGDVLVRVRPRSQEPVASREVVVGRALVGAGVPVVPLANGAEQPWVLGDRVVTAWRWLDTIGAPAPADLGRLAGELRERTAGTHAHDLPRFEPLAAAVDAVSGVPVGDDQADFVRHRAHELAHDWAAVAGTDPCGTGIVHGDLHGDNVLLTADGPVLTDLELAGVGPCSYDVTPAVVAVDRYGADPATLTAFLDARDPQGHGPDPRAWPGFTTCLAVYELWVTAWAVSVRDLAPAWAAEATRRVASLRDGTHQPWTLS